MLSIKRRASQTDAARRPEKRRRINKPVVITKQRSAVEKSRSNSDWEHLLRSSLQSLQGLYQKMDAPIVPKSQVLGVRFPLSLVENDPGTVASKAIHHASGCCSEGGVDEDDGYNSSSSTTEYLSDSDNNSEGPATPDATQIDEEIDIDLIPSADARLPSWGP